MSDEVTVVASKKEPLNKSAHFLLPMLGFPKSYYHGMINTFIGDENDDHYGIYKIYLLNGGFENRLVKHKFYESHYDLDNDLCMYVFEIPEEFKEDYDLFIKGAYSKFSDKYKKKILDLTNTRPIQNSSIYKILYKTKDQRKKIEDMIGQKLLDHEEVCSIPDLKKEIYKR